MQRKKLLKSMCEKAKKKISLAKNINNWYIVNYNRNENCDINREQWNIEQAREAKNNTQKALENEILEKFISKINKITSENLNENEENNSTKGNAKQIRENAKNTYGKEVSNYIVKDARCEMEKWKQLEKYEQ